MKNEMTNKRNPNTPTPTPKGFSIILNGIVLKDDLLWNADTESWEPADELEVGNYISCFKRVIRKK